ncbi:MAG: flagellar biosynthesis anti-sigma factor FlgM [Spirochaetales bacterium]|nr:flagellar biosynthesis anti-sigma factor FlgM [Spirochaetales bacterium]
MTIEKIGSTDPLSNLNKTDKTQKSAKNGKKDTINLSEEAKSKAEIYNATEAAKMAPSIRVDRVEEVKKKLEDPSYINDKLIGDLADKIIEYFEI